MTEIERAREWRRWNQMIAQYIPDKVAMEQPGFFDVWSPEETYRNDDIRRDPKDRLLYRCTVPSGEILPDPTWLPSVATGIWVRIANPAEEWPEFVQPGGQNPPYMTGDKITFEGERYVSLIDNNVWSPTGHPAGWEKILHTAAM